MAPRPNWKGFLKLSLVSCSVALYPATTTSQRIRFNIINRETGNRIRNEVVDAETGEPVEQEDRVKGYQVEKGQYVLLEEDELDNVALESTHTIDIEQFVPMSEVDRIYLDESFYLVPQDDVAQEAFAVIREAMRKEDLVGLARVVIYRREHLLLLARARQGHHGDGAALQHRSAQREGLLRRDPRHQGAGRHAQARGAHPRQQEGPLRSGQVRGSLRERADELIKAKRAGKEPPTLAEPKPSNVINLMDALRRSVKAERRARAGQRARAAAKQRNRRHARRSGKPAKMAGLESYRAKRKFGVTAEPNGKGRRGGAATPSSSRSTRRRGCTTICGSNSTA